MRLLQKHKKRPIKKNRKSRHRVKSSSWCINLYQPTFLSWLRNKHFFCSRERNGTWKPNSRSESEAVVQIMFEITPRSSLAPESHRRHLRQGRIPKTHEGGPTTSSTFHGGVGGEDFRSGFVWLELNLNVSLEICNWPFKTAWGKGSQDCSEAREASGGVWSWKV